MTYNFNNKGTQNELNFVKEINNKKFIEINFLLQLFLENLYESKIDNNEIIKCKKIEGLYKADICIEINNSKKYISIKMGSRNSIHMIGISSFIHFLIENNIPKDIINKYLKYQYADGTTNGTGKTRQSSIEYKKIYQNEIDEINKYFNNYDLVEFAIDKFVLGKNNNFNGIDAIIYGTPDDFLYINKFKIKEVLLNQISNYSTGPHFSNLFIQPEDRCLNYNAKYESRRFCVQIKWYSLFDDILKSMS